ncbi:DNA-binding protein [Pasteurella multocida]|uniref:helix-turn-helix transcriptional regulator n=1 Tax=Pasteurella multocida TaxID=747 RepID=UPI000B69B2D3|nr:AlpA family transcriptional regulator [Pasteurella multocida]MBF6983127.1 AlpA family transcriptional regulator [Pasteurella multocida]OWZ81800.1 DNA-binding protein [Pasteurella multocida]
MMNNPRERFIKLEEVMHITGLKRTTIYNRMNADEFPKNIKLGHNNIAWLESEIRAWMQEKINQRNQEGQKE